MKDQPHPYRFGTAAAPILDGVMDEAARRARRGASPVGSADTPILLQAEVAARVPQESIALAHGMSAESSLQYTGEIFGAHLRYCAGSLEVISLGPVSTEAILAAPNPTVHLRRAAVACPSFYLQFERSRLLQLEPGIHCDGAYVEVAVTEPPRLLLTLTTRNDARPSSLGDSALVSLLLAEPHFQVMLHTGAESLQAIPAVSSAIAAPGSAAYAAHHFQMWSPVLDAAMKLAIGATGKLVAQAGARIGPSRVPSELSASLIERSREHRPARPL